MTPVAAVTASLSRSASLDDDAAPGNGRVERGWIKGINRDVAVIFTDFLHSDSHGLGGKVSWPHTASDSNNLNGVFCFWH